MKKILIQSIVLGLCALYNGQLIIYTLGGEYIHDFWKYFSIIPFCLFFYLLIKMLDEKNYNE